MTIGTFSFLFHFIAFVYICSLFHAYIYCASPQRKLPEEPSKKKKILSSIVHLHGTTFSKSEAMTVSAATLNQFGGDNAALTYSYNHCLKLHEEPMQLPGKLARKRERASSWLISMKNYCGAIERKKRPSRSKNTRQLHRNVGRIQIDWLRCKKNANNSRNMRTIRLLISTDASN